MLDQLRQGARGGVSKLLIALLVLSFAVWGIGGFQGYGAGTVASVGDAQVTVQEFARFYDRAQRNARQAGGQANPEQVLSVMMLNAALDDAAMQYGLGVSDDRVAAEVAKNQMFLNEDGSFNRERFTVILNNAGINRDDFIHDLRRDLVRNQIANTLGAGLEVPQPLVAALYRLQNEERTVSFFVVDATAIAPVGAPGETDLQAYFDENKPRFRAPEYRKLALLTLDPATTADPAAVTDEELAAEYELRRANFTQPERRRIEQIRLESAEAVAAALTRIEGGEDFSVAAAASGSEVTDLGVKTKAEVLDPVVAEVAFAAEPNKPIAVTEGALDPSLILVTSIEREAVTTLVEVGPRLRQELAIRAAREQAHDLYDQVEDERAGGSTLQEAAAKLGLPYRVVEGVSAGGRAPDGSAVADIPESTAVLREVFESDVGIENSPIRGPGDSWVFFDVLDVIPSRDRALDEVRDEAVAAWTANETETRIAALADSLFARLKTGASLATLAAEIGKPVQTVENVKRDADTLSGNAVSQAFAGPEGHVANADGDGQERILLKVDKVIVPAYFAEAADATTIRQQVSQALRNDLLSTYNRQLLATRPTTLNSLAYQQLTGQLQTQ